MASESLAEARRIRTPTDAELETLKRHNWVCDYEAHRALWEAQSILRLAADAMDEVGVGEIVQQAIYGAERILIGQIRRTGWEGMGARDSDRLASARDEAAAAEPSGRQLAGKF